MKIYFENKSNDLGAEITFNDNSILNVPFGSSKEIEIKENNITTLMVTHNMKQALEYGNRLLMMHEGKVLFDIKDKDKRELTTEKLMDMFSKANVIDEVSDRSLLTSLA